MSKERFWKIVRIVIIVLLLAAALAVAVLWILVLCTSLAKVDFALRVGGTIVWYSLIGAVATIVAGAILAPFLPEETQ